jgi:nitrile hydratase subunit beta
MSRWPHQLGGRDDVAGPVPGIDDEARFHEAWEARVFAVARAASSRGLFTTDDLRHAVERIDASVHHRLTYFERWLAALERLMVEQGFLTEEEVAAAQQRRLQDHVHGAGAPLHPPIAVHPAEHLEAPAATERFAVGDRVVLRGGLGEHHRLPDWAAGREATVTARRGRFPLPDLIVARAAAPSAYALYAVEMPATDAFADADPRDRLYLDVYDPYLEPVEESR